MRQEHRGTPLLRVVAAILLCAGGQAAFAAAPWHETLDAAKAKAGESGKGVFVYCYTTRAKLSAEIRGTVMTPEFVARMAERYELLQLDAAAQRDAVNALVPGKFRFPIAVILYPTGEVKETIEDLPDIAQWKQRLEQLASAPKPAQAADAAAPAVPVDELFKQAAEHAKAGRRAEAKELYLRVLTQEPSNTRALNNLGVMEGLDRNFDKAVHYFQLLLLYNPNDEAAKNNLAKARAAADAAKPAPTPEPAPAPAKRKGVKVGGKAGVKQAQPTPVATAAPDRAQGELGVEELLTKADEAMAASNLKEATDYYMRVLTQDDANIVALNNLGALAAKQGGYAQAIAYWRRVLEIAPGDADAQRNISLAESKLNK